MSVKGDKLKIIIVQERAELGEVYSAFQAGEISEMVMDGRLGIIRQKYTKEIKELLKPNC